MTRARLWVVARIVVSVGLLAWVVARAEWGELGHTIRDARPFYFVLFVASTPLSVYLCVAKWKLLLATRGADVPTRRLFGLYVVGQFYNNLLPSSIGGDVVRVAALRREVPSASDAVGSVFVERLTGLFVLTLLGAMALVFLPGLRAQPLVTGIVVGSVLAHVAVVLAIVDRRVLGLARRLLGWLPLAGRLFDKLEGFRAYLDGYRKSPGVLVRCLGLSALFYLVSILNVFFAAAGIGDWVAFWKCAIATPVTQLVAMLPIAINGVGFAEWAFTHTFELLGASAATGLAAGLAIRVRNLLWAAIGYAILSACGVRRDLALPPEEASPLP